MSAAEQPDGSPVDPPPVPGYTLETPLGRGGSGEVWRAVPRGGGAPVAIKVLVEGDAERQAREAALLAELDHPHLVRLREVVHQPCRGGSPRVALVLDLLPGGSLAALLARRRRLRPGEVVTAVAPIASALAHAHAQGVVHGDLSPGNILFTREGRPILTDLGMARVLGETPGGEVTAAYVDPTVARGGAPGPASDVFGLAAAAFHALTGVPPWNAADPAETLAVAAAGHLPDLAELAPEAPAELLAVISRGLAADPAVRGPAAAFALDLRHACRPEPVRLPVVGVPDAELARTGRGPRTELTHQVPGRRARDTDPGGPPAAANGRSGLRAWRPSRRRPGIHRNGSGARRWPRRAGTPAGSVPRRGGRVPVRRLRVPLAIVTAALLAAAGWAGVRLAGSGPAAVAAAQATPWAPGQSPAAASSAGPAGTASGGGAGGPAQGSSDRQEAPETAEQWRQLVQELYTRRAQAFGTGSGALLGDVYTTESPELVTDEKFLGRLTAARQVLRGFAPTVAEVTAAAGTDGRVELQIVDGWPDYDVVTGDRDGAAAGAAPGHAPAPARLVMVRTPAGWRIAQAHRLAAP